MMTPPPGVAVIDSGAQRAGSPGWVTGGPILIIFRVRRSVPRQRRRQHARYVLQALAACQPSGSEMNDKALAMTSTGSKARLVLASRAILGGVCSAVSKGGASLRWCHSD